MNKQYTYTCLIAFTSISLGQTFKPGDFIKAPSRLGRDWINYKLAKRK